MPPISGLQSSNRHRVADGDMVPSSATDEQQVGGCLLDKVQAISNENGLKAFPNDLKVDLAACCTKISTPACVKELSPVYACATAAQRG